jgi:hypothetical protein
MYEEFGEADAGAGTQSLAEGAHVGGGARGHALRSEADPGLLQSARLSLLGLLSSVLSADPGAVYEPLVGDDTASDGGGGGPAPTPIPPFSTDSCSIGTVSTGGPGVGHASRLKSFYVQNSRLDACVLNLISTTIGSGVLGLPYALSKTGWVLGVLLLMGCGVLSAFSLHLVSICAARSQPFSIQNVLRDTHISYGVVVELSQFINCFGACLSYLVVIGSLMSTMVEGFGVTHSVWIHRQVWVVIGFIIVAPPCFIEKLDTLKYTSGMSLLFIIFVACIIFVYSTGSPDFDPCVGIDNDEGEQCRGDTHAGSFSLDTVRVLSIFVFAFSGIQVRLLAIVLAMPFPVLIIAWPTIIFHVFIY